MRAIQVATALCALCALLACAMATEQKMFAEAWHEAKAGVASRSRPSSSYEQADVKHLCLQEANQYNCRTVGCQNFQACPEDGSCPDCVTNIVFQSDLTCCGDRSGLYDGGSPPAPATADWQSPYLRIGTCDWDITIDQDAYCYINPGSPGCAIRRAGPFNNNMWAYRAGSAWATCYLTEGSEYCDDTLCDKMVLTFQGGFYVSAVRSTTPESLRDNNENICGPGVPLPPIKKEGSSQKTAAKKDANKGAKASTASYGDHKEEEELYPGIAFVMSGSITVTSVEKKVGYQTGHMDYVYDFRQIDTDLLASQFGPGDYTKMTPNTYKIKLVGDKKATY